jgi:hypothetical protein
MYAKTPFQSTINYHEKVINNHFSPAAIELVGPGR